MLTAKKLRIMSRDNNKQRQVASPALYDLAGGNMSDLEMYSARDVEVKAILPRLRELGYVEEDAARDVIVRYQYSLTVQQGRRQRTIFADMVVFVQGSPVIVIDSKHPREYLTDNDREQVISYARLIGDIAPYSVLCNGRAWQYFDTFTKQQLPGIPAYSELIPDQQKRRLSARQRETLVNQATRTLFAIDSARELSRIMRQCHRNVSSILRQLWKEFSEQMQQMTPPAAC